MTLTQLIEQDIVLENQRVKLIPIHTSHFPQLKAVAINPERRLP